MRYRRQLGLTTLGLGTLVNPLDTSVNIAFPFITNFFSVPVHSIQWIVICYVLTYACLMLVFGRLGDLVGHRRIFITGLIVSAISLLLCALSFVFEIFLLCRVLQGIGAALILSCGPALVAALYPETMRGRALGNYTIIFGIGAVLGPICGGFLIDVWGWQSVFLFRIPLTIIALAMTGFLRQPKLKLAKEHFDFVGALLLITCLGSLLLAINRLQDFTSDWVISLCLLLVFSFSLLSFIRRGNHRRTPIIKLTIFRNLGFSILNVANILTFFVSFSVLLLVPYFLINILGRDAFSGGLILAGPALGMILAAPIGGRLSDRVSARRISLIGCLLVAISTATISLWTPDSQIMTIMIPLLIQGFGLGLFQVSFTHIATGQLPREDRGVAGSLALVTRTIGLVLGASVIMFTFTGLQSEARLHESSTELAFLEAFQSTFLYAGTLLIGFLLITFIRPRIWLRNK